MDGRAESSFLYQASLADISDFDIVEWYPAYSSCQRYFLDHAQYEPGTQALCSLINIRLPFQWLTSPITSSAIQSPTPSAASPTRTFTFGRMASSANSPGQPLHTIGSPPAPHVSLIPYIRRLVITGFDKPAILHGFFGDDYNRGVLPHLECERRNYLFTARSGGWVSCRTLYDTGSGGGGDESVPFLKPLATATINELTSADKSWNNWQAMEDWQIGARTEAEQPLPSSSHPVASSSTTAANNVSNGSHIQ